MVGLLAQPQSFADLLPREQQRAGRRPQSARPGFFVGVRPEHLSLTVLDMPRTRSPPRSSFVEPLGQTTSLHLQAQAARFMLVTGRTNVAVGETVSVVAVADHVRVIEASHSVHDKN